LRYSLGIKSKDPYKVAAKMTFNLSLIAGQLFQLWHKYIEILTICPRFICELMQIQYKRQIALKYLIHS